MRKYTLNKTTKLYHLSMERMDGRVLYPRVPESRADNEDAVTKRVCFSTSIRGCVKAICAESIMCSAYIYEPADIDKIKDNIVVPSTNEVSDVKDTREKWVTCPVELKLVGVVRIIPGIPGISGNFKTKIIPAGENIITTDIYDNPVTFTNKFQAHNYDLIISSFKELYNEYEDLAETCMSEKSLRDLFYKFNTLLHIHQCYCHFPNCGVFLKFSSHVTEIDDVLYSFYTNIDILSNIPQFRCIAKLGKDIIEPLKYFRK